jgi:glycosyltransferase involved in cell wall biosynthesis
VLIKVALVSRLYPSTHYSLYLGRGLAGIKDRKLNLVFYSCRDEKIPLNLLEVKNVWSKNVLYPLQILRRVLKDHPDVVHIQHEFSMFGGPLTALEFPILLVFLKLARVRSIVTIHAIVPSSIVDKEFTRTYGLPGRLWVLLLMLLTAIYHSTVALSSALIVHAESHRFLLQTNYAANPAKVSVIPIGVPTIAKEEPTSRKWRSLIEGNKALLFFGYLTGRKGVEYLLLAFAQLAKYYPSWILVVAGGKLSYSDNYIESLRRLITELGIGPRVIMVTTTPFPSDELYELFEISEFVVMPYTQPIGGGSLVLSYAIQHGKPVVVTDSAVMRELVQDGKEGLFCQARNVDSLRHALKTMMEDETLRENMSEALRRKAQRLTWTSVAETTNRLYLELSVPREHMVHLDYKTDHDS